MSIERLRALEKKWRGFLHAGYSGDSAHELERCADELATLIAELGQEVGAVADAAALLVRDVCEMAPSDPDAPDTVCIRVADLTRIAELYTSPAHTSEAGDGVSLIAAERRRQMESEGWSLEHDDAYEINELACAAACYVVPPQFRDPLTIMAELWPWHESWWKPGDRIRELAKAGALIAAEIDRLERAAMRQEGGSDE